MSDETLRYPIGRFVPNDSYSPTELVECIRRIQTFPSRLSEVVEQLTSVQLDSSYREGGWTARQVVHHLADSHTNAYIRFKWTLTEDTPVIKAYDEKRWAATAEVKSDPRLSLAVLTALHAKWSVLLSSLTPEDLSREYIHPETKKHNRLDRIVAMYAWHGDHHAAHLRIIANK